jgi:hypothetical protein
MAKYCYYNFNTVFVLPGTETDLKIWLFADYGMNLYPGSKLTGVYKRFSHDAYRHDHMFTETTRAGIIMCRGSAPEN